LLGLPILWSFPSSDSMLAFSSTFVNTSFTIQQLHSLFIHNHSCLNIHFYFIYLSINRPNHFSLFKLNWLQPTGNCKYYKKARPFGYWLPYNKINQILNSVECNFSVFYVIFESLEHSGIPACTFRYLPVDSCFQTGIWRVSCLGYTGYQWPCWLPWCMTLVSNNFV